MSARYRGAREAGRPAKKIGELRHSIRERSTEFRKKFRSRAGRLWAAQELDTILSEVLTDEVTAEQVSDAGLFNAVDGLKARTLLDQLGGRFIALSNLRKAAEVASMERELLAFASANLRDTEQNEMRLISQLPVGTLRDRDERRARLAPLEAVYADCRAGFEDIESVADLSEVQETLRPGEAIVEYFIPHHPLHPAIDLLILGISHDAFEAVRVDLSGLPQSGFIGRLAVDGAQPLDASPLGEVAFSLRSGIRESDDDKAQAILRSLYELLILPLHARGFATEEFDHLIIVPHGMLHAIPFTALSPGPGRYLIQDVALTVAPSSTVWQRLAALSRPAVTQFLGLANPTLTYCDLPKLRGAEKEIARIVKSLKGLKCTVLKGPQATESALRKQVPGKGILHLATHGEFPELDAIDFHQVLLSASDDHDGRVHAEELREMDLRAVRLAVLSICNGGLYRFGPGDEPYGLIAALLGSGVENVLGTLWPLEDEIGRVFMTEYYRHLLRNGPAGALQVACKQFIEDGALLRHWAAFGLVGPGRSLT